MDESFQFFRYEQDTFLDDELMFDSQDQTLAFPHSPSFSLTSLSGDTDLTESSCDDSAMTPEYSSPGPQSSHQIIATQNTYNNVLPVGTTLTNSQLSSPKNPFLSNNCKKRKLDQNPENVEIILPRDVLRKTTCDELDEQVKLVTQYRELTPAEEYAISRQRRLIKSRQYANNARNKKKQESETLRQENDRLIAEKGAMAQTIGVLQQENHRLLAENNQFRLMLGNMGIACPPAYSAPVPTLGPKAEPKTTLNLNATASFSRIPYIAPSGPPQKPSEPIKSALPSHLRAPVAMGMTSLVLFVIMFSFAVFTLPNVLSSAPGFSAYTDSGQFESHSARRIMMGDPSSLPSLLTFTSNTLLQMNDILRPTDHCSASLNHTFTPPVDPLA